MSDRENSPHLLAGVSTWLTFEAETKTELVAALVEVLHVDVRAECELNAGAEAMREAKTQRALVVDLGAERGVLIDGEHAA